MSLLVGRAASLAALTAAGGADGLLLLVAQRDAETQEPAAADLYRVGVIARVRQLSRMGSGTVRVLVEGVTRAPVTRYVPGGDTLRAGVEPRPRRSGARSWRRGSGRSRCVRACDASCVASSEFRRCRRSRASPGRISNGLRRCHGRSARMTCWMSRTRARYSTRITTDSPT